MPAAARPLTAGLHHGSDDAQAERSRNLKRLAARRKLESQGTTANRETWQGNREWVADLEYVWRMRIDAERVRLGERAKRLRASAHAMGIEQIVLVRALSTVLPRPSSPFKPRAARRRYWPQPRPVVVAPAPTLTALQVKTLRSAEWAENRARACALPREDVVNTCRKRWRKIACKCGWRELQVGCDAPQLCASCRQKHWFKWRKRITKSMRAHVSAARAEWNTHRRGMLPGVYLLTLTGPHSGDLVADRRVMGGALRELLKRGRALGWWSHYAATWEATAGDDGLGHLHLHMACVSSWIPYEQLHEVWRAALPGARIVHVSPPSAKHGRRDAGRAANYLAKYVTKGIEPRELTGRKAGELLVAFRGKRKVTTSRHFWVPEHRRCKHCGCQHWLAEAPCSLQDIAPAAVIRAMMERSRYRPPRGEPQVMLRWDVAPP